MGKSASQKIAASERKARVGENIVLARESLGMTQAEFARQYHMASNLLNQWEAGLYYPDPIFLMQLCDDYGFTMDWFYRGILAGVSSERAAGLRRVSVEKPEA